MRCYNCNQQGHFASRCPSKAALFTGQEHPKPSPETQREELEEAPPTVLEGEVDGALVRDILVDTGAAKTMVRKGLVSEEKLMGEGSGMGHSGSVWIIGN